MGLKVSTTEMPSYWVVSVEGEMEFANASQLEKEARFLEGAEKDVVVILNHIDLFDSAGMAFVVMVFRSLQERSLKLAVVSKNDMVVDVFRMTRMTDLIPVFEDFKQATSYLLGGK